ncbi:MAG: hypothetical protein ACT4TC_09895 [Myxococcaceae bacterium]
MASSAHVFKQAYDAVERRIENRYGIPVSVADVLEPNTGDFDGMRIQVDYDQDLESAFFVLVHLFGHTVQWNLSEHYRALGTDLSIGKSDDVLAQIYDYEKNATRYSLQLMHDAKVTDLDRWVSDWWHADWDYLRHYYRTGEKLDFRSLLHPGKGEQLTPLSIPEFAPQKWLSRWSF